MGTPGSCTSRAVVRAVARGGVIAFDCGPQPVTIAMWRTAQGGHTSPRVVLDGGGCSNGSALSSIRGSRLTDNPSDGFETLPGIFFLGESRTITDSVVR